MKLMLTALWLLIASALPAQLPPPTARDSAHVPTQLRLLKAISDETRRQGSMRKVPTRAWADSLIRYEMGLLVAPIPPPPPPVNAPPVASFEVSCANTTRMCAFNASASTDDKVVVSFQWDFGDGHTISGAMSSHTFDEVGTFNVKLKVQDAEGLADSTSRPIVLTGPEQPPPDTGVVALAALPRNTPSLTVPAPTRVVNVLPGMNLQTALDNAQGGDDLRLSGSFVGNFTFNSCRAGWVTVSGSTSLPPVGTRVTPTMAAGFAKIVSNNTEPALKTTGPACRWVFRGLEFRGELESTQFLAYGIVRFGGGRDDGQSALAQVPFDIILERSYIRGTANHNNTRCVVVNSANTIVRDNWISECHARGSDSQAILGWNGPGPFLIDNNRLEGAGENIMFGGADPWNDTLTPRDITIRRNHIIKPLVWRPLGWSYKNLLELKNAEYVLIEENVLENSWPASQEGMAVVIKSSQDSCGICNWEGTTNVTFRWNIVRDAAVGFNLQAVDGSGQVAVDRHVTRVTITDNLFERIGAEGRGALFMFTHDLTDVLVTRNTATHAGSNGIAILMAYSPGARRLAWQQNLMTSPAGYTIYTESGLHFAGLQAATGNTSVFADNVVPFAADFGHLYPASNTFPSTIPITTAVGVNRTELQARTAGVVVSP